MENRTVWVSITFYLILGKARWRQVNSTSSQFNNLPVNIPGIHSDWSLHLFWLVPKLYHSLNIFNSIPIICNKNLNHLEFLQWTLRRKTHLMKPQEEIILLRCTSPWSTESPNFMNNKSLLPICYRAPHILCTHRGTSNWTAGFPYNALFV